MARRRMNHPAGCRERSVPVATLRHFLVPLRTSDGITLASPSLS
jgi:hypothetical protein